MRGSILKRPFPALRPGRLVCALPLPLENGAVARLPARNSSRNPSHRVDVSHKLSIFQAGFPDSKIPLINYGNINNS
jgi:hypothetical protein